MKHNLILLALICCQSFLWSQTSLYFPPKVGNTWQTIAPSSLGFCPEKIDSLYQFLEDSDTKVFLLLQDGKIVLEKYFGTFKQDSFWYWASAGKSLTGFMVGQAQEQGLLNLNDPSQQYLGAGWTSSPTDKEALITVRHQLTMTAGLNDLYVPAGADPLNCTEPNCLQYKADAGTRWAYHNGPYLLLHDVIAAASSMTINQFTKQQVLDHTGMKGIWINGVFYSRPRDMARYGLTVLAKGIWDGDTLLHDAQYFYDMTHTSQELNKSYGYLWWLNGQPSYMLPLSQIVFPVKLIPNAPDDMIAALGKNDQKIYVVPSKNWVVVRMGNDGSNNGSQVPIVFDNKVWKYLNDLACTPVATETPEATNLLITPNPSKTGWQITAPQPIENVVVTDVSGKVLQSFSNINQARFWVDNGSLPNGIFHLKITINDHVMLKKAVKI